MYKFSFLFLAILLIYSCQDDKKPANNAINNSKMTQNNNPLLQDWQTPFGTAPLDQIKSEDYLPAFKFALQQHNTEIEKIVANKDKSTFDNTIVTLEQSGKLLKRIMHLFDAVESANTDDVLKETSKQIKPLLAAHFDQITMNKALFKRVATVYKSTDLTDIQDKKLLDKTYKNFVRSGVNLPEEKQERLKAINKELASLSQQFNDNLLSETNDYELFVTNKKDLGNMPKAVLDAAVEEAQKRGHKSGWSFTLQRPSIYPFLDYATNRKLRKQIFDAYAHRGNNNNAHDNKKVVEKMIQLRAAKAHLLGFDNYADYVLDEQMAKNAENVFKLLDQIWQPALATAKKDRDMMAKMMQSEGIKDKFMASDWRYYVRKIRSQNYNFDENETRPYFEVNAVRDGAFLLANKLFGLHFKENKNIATWHKDQQAFEVTDNEGKHIGIIYMDFFTRPGKRGGAWMNELRMQSNVNGNFVTPIVSNNFNFPPPTKDTPSLLNFDQAQTVFHEFGHGLHGLLSKVKYASLSGTNVPRDFVEFPSQVMENWMSDPEMLKLYAKHYKTGEVIPAELVAKMNNANNFDVGFRTVEYMAAAYLDMYWHTLSKNTDQETVKFENIAMQKIGLIDEIIPRYRSTYYAHIFGGGYAAGYYSYLWSEVLDADAFAAFKETGDVFNQELAKKYKKMISSGGTVDGMKLYKAFRGSAPKIDALLARKNFQY
jgi:peptidyl-dipeptidase Dcp